MKTPLPDGDEPIKTVLLEYWQLVVTNIYFIPVGDSAYSYKVEAKQNDTYYLKVVDQRTAVGRRTAAQMDFSQPHQRLIAEHHFAKLSAPLPQLTVQGTLHALDDSLLFALYTFIPGDTLANAYPMSPSLILRIGQALATLHTMAIPEMLQKRSPQESLTRPFDEALVADLAAVEQITSQDAPYLQRLREVVWPQRELIRGFLARSCDYEKKARQVAIPPVVCHGDAWGGNMILSSSGMLTLLDWEAAVMATPERDAYIYMGYIGPDFSTFDAGYRMVRKEPVNWNTNLMAYYAYRLQLRNLAHWLHNLLHEPLEEAQRENDITMIEHHCLERLESVERTSAEFTTRSIL